MDSFEKGGDNTFLRIECEVIRSQDPQNPIYLKSYSGSTKARVLNSKDLINRLRDGEEIIAYGIKNPETSEEEEATIKEDGEDVFRMDFYKKIDMPKIFARFWLKKEDENLFESCFSDEDEIPYTDLRNYSDHILTGRLKKPGELSRITGRFVLGRKKIQKLNTEKMGFVYIKNNSAYPEGLTLVPLDTDMQDLKSIKSGSVIKELLGSDEDDFVENVFKTYGDSSINKSDKKDYRLLLYEMIKK